jgi:ketosteroid isomerase-like protein
LRQDFYKQFKIKKMKTPIETVKDFYSKLSSGDAPGAMALMTDDIEWITMLDFSLQGRGPQLVAEKVLMPLMQEWESFAPVPNEFIVANDIIVSLGNFTCVHRETKKTASATYAHVWNVIDGKIGKFRQYIDTLAIAEARKA